MPNIAPNRSMSNRDAPTAIISFGRVTQQPVVVGDDLGIAPVLPVSLSFDHRVIDGGLGRRFMDRVVEGVKAGST